MGQRPVDRKGEREASINSLLSTLFNMPCWIYTKLSTASSSLGPETRTRWRRERVFSAVLTFRWSDDVMCDGEQQQRVLLLCSTRPFLFIRSGRLNSNSRINNKTENSLPLVTSFFFPFCSEMRGEREVFFFILMRWALDDYSLSTVFWKSDRFTSTSLGRCVYSDWTLI
jgi:hypothetical protein